MPASKRGTGFVGLQQYLGLNQGAAQSMAEKLTGQAQSAMDKYRGNVDAATQAFSTKATGQQKPVGEEHLTNEQLRAMSGGMYTGPMGLGDVADMGALEAEQARVGNMAGALGSNAGRAALLAQQNPGQGYGWGSQALDAALAGAGGGAALGQARGGWEGLKAYLGQAQAGAADKAQRAQADTQQAAEWARGELTPTRQAERMPVREVTPREEAERNRPGYKPRRGGY